MYQRSCYTALVFIDDCAGCRVQFVGQHEQGGGHADVDRQAV